EVLQKAAIGCLVDLHLPVERQQHRHIEMIADSPRSRFMVVSSFSTSDESASSRYSIGTASMSTKATTQGAFERLAQAWLMPRWIRKWAATGLVSPTSMTAQISPESTIA